MEPTIVNDTTGIKRIIGFHIESADIITGQGNPKLVIRLSHIACEYKVDLVVQSGVEMQITGLTIRVIPGMSIVTSEVKNGISTTEDSRA